MFGFLKEKLKAAVKKVTGVLEGKKEGIEPPKPEDFKEIPQETAFAEEKAKEEAAGEEAQTKEEPEEAPKAKETHISEKKQVHEEKLESFLPHKIEEKAAHAEAKAHAGDKRDVPKWHEEPKKQEARIETKKQEINMVEEKQAKLQAPGIEEKHEAGEKPEAPKEEKKGFFAKLKEAIVTTKVSSEKFDELFWELEVALLENNVAFEVIEKIKADLKRDLVESPIKRGDVEGTIMRSLMESVESLFDVKTKDIIKEAKAKKEKPYVITFFGTNGSGKTTTIAKLAYLFQKNGLKCVLAAGDTWRSAAIQQLEEHAKKLNVPIVKHDYGADPAAVAFDGIKMAQARNIDVVMVDTAGRQHSNANLIDEMKKIVRIAKPDLKVYVGEMIAGNDCIEQIQSFDSAIQIDGAILTKADIDEKGGTAISLSYVTKKPIFYLCTGQEYSDIEPFEKERILKNLGF